MEQTKTQMQTPSSNPPSSISKHDPKSDPFMFRISEPSPGVKERKFSCEIEWLTGINADTR